ncbi:MAG: hypothetical protein ABI767_04255, partial [Rhodanobacter sp.]
MSNVVSGIIWSAGSRVRDAENCAGQLVLQYSRRDQRLISFSVLQMNLTLEGAPRAALECFARRSR